MAIEKMTMLNLIGTIEEEHAILEQVALSERVHRSLEGNDKYEKEYIAETYKHMLQNRKSSLSVSPYSQLESKYAKMQQEIAVINGALRNTPKVLIEEIKAYDILLAEADLEELKKEVEPIIKQIDERKTAISKLEQLYDKIKYITHEDINLKELKSLKHFDYQIGLLSKESRIHIKKNYENINAIVTRIGNIEDSKENIYCILYLKRYRDEINHLLKSLNWQKITMLDDFEGSIAEVKECLEAKKDALMAEIEQIEETMFKNKEEKILLLNKIYTRVQLESKIGDLSRQVVYGENLMVLNAWIRKKDRRDIEEVVADITDKYLILTKEPKELPNNIMPPTMLKNNWFFRPFESIVKLYGLPSFNEVDPTPFLAITFCLMFGIMFGDVGQGFIYFAAGLLFYKKDKTVGGVLTRLGASSMIFGLVYGSFFGLEDIPILEHIRILEPLKSSNILIVLIMGIAVGVGVLTVSYLFGVINYLRNNNLEHALFGKNGIAGYIFFISLIFTMLCLSHVIHISVLVPILAMVITLIIMVLKEPLTNLILNKRPLIHGSSSEYYIESGFEGVETVLSTLSNAISFIRVGAFALNHAGLFLAFLVIAEMMPNIVAKFVILVVGNILILSLEGLVVFIQGLRLQYYEMFSKYFSGEGVEYNPVRIK